MGTPEPGIYMGTRLSAAAGYLVWEEDGKRSQLAIANILRAADIPALTYEQVGAIKALANMFAVLYRALISKDILDDGLLEDGGYDMSAIVQTIEDMGGDFIEPDLTVT